jgi:hypothetical protein
MFDAATVVVEELLNKDVQGSFMTCGSCGTPVFARQTSDSDTSVNYMKIQVPAS